MIKKALTILAVALTGILASPKAEAGHSSLSITYRSGYASCGCPTHTRRHFRGYDCYRRPIFSYSRIALRHGSSCRHRAVHRRVHAPVYRSNSGYRRGYSHRARPRGNSRGHSRGYSRGRSCR